MNGSYLQFWAGSRDSSKELRARVSATMATLPTWGAVPLAQGMAKSLAETGIRAAGSTTVVGSLSSLMPEWLASSMASGEKWLLMGRGDPKTKKGKVSRLLRRVR